MGSWLIPGIFSIVIGIAGGIFGSCAGLLFGGLGLVGAGIYKMFTTVPYGLLLMGGGFLMIAGGICYYGSLYGSVQLPFHGSLQRSVNFGTEILGEDVNKFEDV